MWHFFTKFPFYSSCLFLTLVFQGSFVDAQNPAILSGVITNAANGSPVIGAKIMVANQMAYSVYNGLYTMSLSTPGAYTVTCTKTGFDNFISSPVTLQAGVTTTLNVPLSENTNAPASVLAVLDTIIPRVHVSWPLPSGPYEILYDDGIQDNFTIWVTQGNMNALKFTPAGYPVTITGGSIDIGTSSNYPVGSNPFVPFQVYLYNATGPQGTPGSPIAGPIDVIPTALGWVDFTVPSPPTLNSGNFYIVMVQVGNFPNAAGLAVDETYPQLRSYSRSGSGPWIPADGNFMMRAIVNGPGGPLNLTDQPESVINYQIWRLKQGEEMNPIVWTSVGVTAGTSLYDNSWPSLPCGPYRWSVKVQYTGNRWSNPVFSNVIGKCWIVPVTVHVDLSCTTSGVEGTDVRLTNLVYPDTLYSGTADTSGSVHFNKVWKGTYNLEVTKFGYQDFNQNTNISQDTTFTVFLLQVKSPPLNLTINNKTLKAIWNVPVTSYPAFNEDWSGGNFTTNGWTINGGTNWVISMSTGMPAPSVMFGPSPQKTNYTESLISKYITGQHSTVLQLKYNIYLDNYGTTTINQMAVEIWDGAAWNTLKNYTSSGGDIPWENQSVDISAYTDMTFKIRFRAYGGDTFDINGWYIDNIAVVASESESNMNACILGYNLYLQNALVGFTQDTTYTLPGDEVQYGNTYLLCVQAIYGSGYSSKTCTTFNSTYLVPPANLVGTGIENAAFLTWDKPQLMIDSKRASGDPPGLIGYKIYKEGALHDSIMNPDSLSYYDYGLDPGTYTYMVSAKYNLTAYGFPGQFDESLQQGPATVFINYGFLLPFLETWDQGTFNYNLWNFDPVQGDWIISASDGNPEPSAEFYWQPPVTIYSYALVSPVMNGTAITCASVWVDYDCRLINQNPTGKESLSVDVYYNGVWHNIVTYFNNQALPWFSEHKKINPVEGKAFKVRFVASGSNSADIVSWNVDNIHIYADSYPARNLSGDPQGYDVHLTWSPPDCVVGNTLNEGFEESFFPPLNWTQVITNTFDTWLHTASNSPMGVHSGNYAAGITTSYTHQDEWLIAHNIAITGPLVFWSFAFQGSTHNDHYYVKISPDSGITWQILLDLSALPPYPGSSGYNQWNTPYTIDMSYFLGQVLDIAWQAVDGAGQGLWYPWSIDDCTVGSDKLNPVYEPTLLAGYDIYRQDPDSVNFHKINNTLVPDTSYIDPSLPAGEFRYYVNAVFDQCTPTPSDTILLDVVTGVDQPVNNNLLIYPNPVNNLLTVSSSRDVILNIELTECTGQRVFIQEGLRTSFLTINTSSFQPGIYFLKAGTQLGTKVKKIIIFR